MQADAHQNLDADPESGAASEPEPIMDRRLTGDRRRTDRRQTERRGTAKQSGTTGAKRRKAESAPQGATPAPTRAPRNINQYDMSDEEMEFVNAVLRFREGTGNRFPKARDILRILKDLGYEKRTDG